MIVGIVARSLRGRCARVAALGCVGVVLSAVQSPVAYGQAAPGWTFQSLATYDSNGSPARAWSLQSTVTVVGTNLYTVATNGSTYNASGYILSVAANGSNYSSSYATDYAYPSTDITTFTNGEQPVGGLTAIGSTLYGMAQSGGNASDGYLYSVPTAGGPVTTLLTFSGTATGVPGRLPGATHWAI